MIGDTKDHRNDMACLSSRALLSSDWSRRHCMSKCRGAHAKVQTLLESVEHNFLKDKIPMLLDLFYAFTNDGIPSKLEQYGNIFALRVYFLQSTLLRAI